MPIRRKAIKAGSALAGIGFACAGGAVVAVAGHRRKKTRRLQSKVVLITGSSRGLGLALAEEFGRHGAKLVLTARDSDELERARVLLLKRGAVTDPADLLVVPSDPWFTGDASREYRWFSLAASLPGISIAASSTARKIVRAAIAGTSEIAITPQAILAARLGNVFPSATALLMHTMSSLLPEPGSSPASSIRGTELRDREFTPATTLGTLAARRYNEIG